MVENLVVGDQKILDTCANQRASMKDGDCQRNGNFFQPQPAIPTEPTVDDLCKK